MEQASPLEHLRNRLAVAVGENAVFDGWTSSAVESAANQQGIDPAQAQLAMPKDKVGMIDAFIAGVDLRLEEALPPATLAAMKIRERIRSLVWKRLEIMADSREAVRSGLSVLSLPQNAATGLKLSWRSADHMWRLAGDTATDFNHYTKRLTLAAVYGSTLLVWLDDQSEGWVETAAFLDRRIDDVMKIEKVKAQWRVSSDRRPSLSRFLGRLRYPPK